MIPSNEQKGLLRQQLDKMSADQWLAMVRWTLPQLIEDQEFTVELICDECQRRMQRFAEHHPSGELLLPAALISVLKDLRLVCISKTSGGDS